MFVAVEDLHKSSSIDYFPSQVSLSVVMIVTVAGIGLLYATKRLSEACVDTGRSPIQILCS